MHVGTISLVGLLLKNVKSQKMVSLKKKKIIMSVFNRVGFRYTIVKRHKAKIYNILNFGMPIIVDIKNSFNLLSQIKERKKGGGCKFEFVIIMEQIYRNHYDTCKTKLSPSRSYRSETRSIPNIYRTHWIIFSFRNRKRKKQILVLKYLKRHTFVFQIKFDNAQ